MIRKISHIFIVAILLISTTGVTLSMHYSGNKLYSVSIFGEANSCCEVPCDCCNDVSDQYKLDTDYLLSDNETLQIKITDFAIDLYFSKTVDQLLSLYKQYSQYNYPIILPYEEINKFTLHQSFLC